MVIDWAMPEEIIFNSFDIFDEDEFVDTRTQKLIDLIETLVKSISYEHYLSSATYKSTHGHAYFKEIDDNMNFLFVLRTQLGYEFFKESFKNDISQNTIEIKGQSYELDSPKALLRFFEHHPEVNRAATINGLANMVINKFELTELLKEEVYESYNGLVNIYVDCISLYSIYKLSKYDLPAKNDFSDLTHILYLKNSSNRKIVSDDGLFKKYLKGYVITFSELIS
jgi:hypothetical protein